MLAGIFGANLVLDAFIVANRIPNLLRELLAEGALGASFTQVFSNLKEKDPKRADIFLKQSFQFFSCVVILVCIVGMIFAPEIVRAMTFFSADSPKHARFLHDTVGLTRVLFPFIAFMTVGAIASGALHQKGRFFTSTVSSVALNVGYIVGATVFAQLLVQYGPEWIDTSIANRSVVGLSLGVLLGGFCQTLIQVRGLDRSQTSSEKTPFVFPWSQDLKKVCMLMGPMVIAGSAGQINVLVNTNFATSLEEGAVTWLNFSFRVLQLPIGIFAVGVGIISLPSLTRTIAQKGSSSEIASKLQEALTFVTWLVVPCFCFTLLNSMPITQFLYQHGRFTSSDTIATSDALYCYSFSLIAYGFLKVLTSYYYATERTKYAMKVSLVSILVNLTANLSFVSKLGHKGLALSTACTLTMNALLLFRGLGEDKLPWNKNKFWRSLLLISSAFALAYGAQYALNALLETAYFLSSWSIKWRACFLLVSNGLLVLIVFGIFWLADSKRLKVAS